MNTEAAGVRQFLRALADARHGPFAALRRELMDRGVRPIPQPGLWLYRADGDGAHVVIGLEAVSDDGVGICWSVGVEATDAGLVVRGEVEVEGKLGWDGVFERSANAVDPRAASEIIRAFASEVCGQTRWVEVDGSVG